MLDGYSLSLKFPILENDHDGEKLENKGENSTTTKSKQKHPHNTHPQTCKITLICFIICFKILYKQIFFFLKFCGSTKPAIPCP